MNCTARWPKASHQSLQKPHAPKARRWHRAASFSGLVPHLDNGERARGGLQDELRGPSGGRHASRKAPMAPGDLESPVGAGSRGHTHAHRHTRAHAQMRLEQILYQELHTQQGKTRYSKVDLSFV